MFEQAKKRIQKNLARATIRKYVTLYLLEKKEKREQLEYHELYNLPEIIYLQTKWRAWKSKPPKLDIKRFKANFYACLLGWKVRRIMSYLRTLPEIKEAIDFVKLRNDLEEHNPHDMFSRQIIAQYPEKVAIFQYKYEDLMENAIWIKKPTIKAVTKQRKPFVKQNAKREPQSKITKPTKPNPPKPSKIPLEKSKTFKETTKSKVPNSKEPQNNFGSTSLRKHPSERQPKQAPKLASKHTNSRSKLEYDEGQRVSHRYMVPANEKVTLHLEDTDAPRQKTSKFANSLMSTKKSLPSEQRNVAKGVPYGILAQKNELEKRRASKNNSRFEIASPKANFHNAESNYMTTSIPNFQDVRKSFDPQIKSSFREATTVRHNQQEEFSVRKTIMNRKRPELDEIKITPLQERRSLTRKLRSSTITRADEPFSLRVNLNSSRQFDANLASPTRKLDKAEDHDQSLEIDIKDQLSTYGLLTRIISGTLERLGGSEALQLACLEE